MNSTRQWHAPQLYVLVRSKPEEAVLTACKIGNDLGPGDEGGQSENCKTVNSNKCFDLAPS